MSDDSEPDPTGGGGSTADTADTADTDTPTETPEEGSDAVFSSRTRRTGGVLLVLTGIASALLGVALLGFALLGGFAGVPPATVAAVAVPFLVAGLLEAFGGYTAYRARRWRVAVGGGVVGLLFGPFPPLVPVKVVALVFVGISEDQFAR